MSRPSWRLPVVVAISALAVLTMSACASQGGGGEAAGPAADPTGIVSSGPLSPLPDGSAEPTPSLATPVAADDARRQRWNKVELIPGTNDVLVHAALTPGPPCAVLTRVDVAESKKEVTITLWVGKLPGADCNGPQPQVALPIVTKAHLEAPIGARQLRDGAA
ncbi:hypothetical protein [Microlunatus ginsengisoli]|uniref:Uncharacterized protein n=1 Tax=Microlunatus ginsengisoli TaxID=363863 RepID=A0ABP6ZW67_9ACTN